MAMRAPAPGGAAPQGDRWGYGNDVPCHLHVHGHGMVWDCTEAVLLQPHAEHKALAPPGEWQDRADSQALAPPGEWQDPRLTQRHQMQRHPMQLDWAAAPCAADPASAPAAQPHRGNNRRSAAARRPEQEDAAPMQGPALAQMQWPPAQQQWLPTEDYRQRSSQQAQKPQPQQKRQSYTRERAGRGGPSGGWQPQAQQQQQQQQRQQQQQQQTWHQAPTHQQRQQQHQQRPKQQPRQSPAAGLPVPPQQQHQQRLIEGPPRYEPLQLHHQLQLHDQAACAGRPHVGAEAEHAQQQQQQQQKEQRPRSGAWRAQQQERPQAQDDGQQLPKARRAAPSQPGQGAGAGPPYAPAATMQWPKLGGKSELVAKQVFFDATEQVSEEMEKEVKSIQPRRDFLHQRVEAALSAAPEDSPLRGCELQVVGSASWGGEVPQSDLDLALLTPGGSASRCESIRLLRELMGLLEETDAELLEAPRVSILRIRHAGGEKAGASPLVSDSAKQGLSCDICVDQLHTLRHRTMLNNTLQGRPEVLRFVRLVKLWLRRRGLPMAGEGGLSSSCWTVLAVHLAECHPHLRAGELLYWFFSTMCQIEEWSFTMHRLPGAHGPEGLHLEWKWRGGPAAWAAEWIELFHIEDPTSEDAAENGPALLTPPSIPTALGALFLAEIRMAFRAVREGRWEDIWRPIGRATCFSLPSRFRDEDTMHAAPVHIILKDGIVHVGKLQEVKRCPSVQHGVSLHRRDQSSSLVLQQHLLEKRGEHHKIVPQFEGAAARRHALTCQPCHWVCELTQWNMRVLEGNSGLVRLEELLSLFGGLGLEWSQGDASSGSAGEPAEEQPAAAPAAALGEARQPPRPEGELARAEAGRPPKPCARAEGGDDKMTGSTCSDDRTCSSDSDSESQSVGASAQAARCGEGSRSSVEGGAEAAALSCGSAEGQGDPLRQEPAVEQRGAPPEFHMEEEAFPGLPAAAPAKRGRQGAQQERRRCRQAAGASSADQPGAAGGGAAAPLAPAAPSAPPAPRGSPGGGDAGADAGGGSDPSAEPAAAVAETGAAGSGGAAAEAPGSAPSAPARGGAWGAAANGKSFAEVVKAVSGGSALAARGGLGAGQGQTRREPPAGPALPAAAQPPGPLAEAPPGDAQVDNGCR